MGLGAGKGTSGWSYGLASGQGTLSLGGGTVASLDALSIPWSSHRAARNPCDKQKCQRVCSAGSLCLMVPCGEEAQSKRRCHLGEAEPPTAGPEHRTAGEARAAPRSRLCLATEKAGRAQEALTGRGGRERPLRGSHGPEFLSSLFSD